MGCIEMLTVDGSHVHTVEVKSLHPPFRICKMLIILPKEDGSYVYI